MAKPFLLMNGICILDNVKDYIVNSIQTFSLSRHKGGYIRIHPHGYRYDFQNIEELFPFKENLPANIYSLFIFSDKTMYTKRSDEYSYQYNIEEFKRWLL